MFRGTGFRFSQIKRAGSGKTPTFNLKFAAVVGRAIAKEPHPERLDEMPRHGGRREQASDPLAPGGCPFQSFDGIFANFAERRSQVLRPRPRQAINTAAAGVNQPSRAISTTSNLERARNTGDDDR